MRNRGRVVLVCAATLLLTAGYAHPQTACPAINFVNAAEVSLYGASILTPLVHSPDGAYTGYPHQTYGTYLRVQAISNYQDRLTPCQPAPSVPAPLLLSRPAGAASAATLVLPDAGNQTAVAVWNSFTSNNIYVYQSNPDYTFKAVTGIPIAANRAGMLPGDFNVDGIPDILVLGAASATGSPANIFFLKGKGDGTFAAPVISPTGGTLPTSFAQGDFNGDGKPDLAVTHSDGNRVTILLGNGDGTFRAGSTFAAGNSPLSVTVADLNADGRLDLAVANSGDDNVSIFFGNADGTFRAGSKFPAGIGPRYVAVADFNKDGRPDLATIGEALTASVLLGNGDGTFKTPNTYITGYSPEHIIVADINRDGNPDLVIGEGIPEALAPDEQSGAITVFLGNGDGTLQGAPVVYSTAAPLGGATADFNGDGRPDVALAVPSAGVVVLLKAAGQAFQAPLTIPIPASSSSTASPAVIIAGDFNRDGKADIVVADQYNYSIWLIAGNGDGTFQAPLKIGTVASRPRSLAAGDFNGDGRTDLAVVYAGYVASEPHGLQLLLAQSGGGYTASATVAAGTTPLQALAADLNGDGRDDLIVVNQGTFSSTTDTGNVQVFFSKADGTLQTPVIYPAGSYPAAATLADLNGDKKPDLVVASGNFSYSLAILLGGNAGTFQPAQFVVTDYGPASIIAADFNGDGRQDLVVAHCCGETDLTFFTGNGDGTVQPEVHFLGGPSPNRLLIADFNQDAKPDLVVLGGPGGIRGGASLLINNSPAPAAFVNVSDASFLLGLLAPDSVVAAFGVQLANTTTAAANALSTSLGGSTVTVKDASGASLPALIYSVSPGQVNYVMPAGAASGKATVTITSGDGSSRSAEVLIAPVSPGIFQLNTAALAAALILRVKANGDQIVEQVFQVDSTGAVVPLPIDFGVATDTLYLELYGTGIRGRSPKSAVNVTVGDNIVSVPYAGAQSQWAGLDQVNVLLPRVLVGAGLVKVTLNLEGQYANVTKLLFK